MTASVLAAHAVSKTYLGVRKRLLGPRQPIRAVQEVTLAVERAEIFAIIGESGSGKSTLTRLLVGLEPPTSGHVEFEGRRLDQDARAIRRKVQIVFQDPYTSLDPRLTVGASIREPLRSLGYAGDLDARVRAVLDAVALPAGAERKYPHEFSAGQLQRVAIARALAPEPTVIVADEPVSALDVSVQAAVLNVLLDLRDAMGLTIVLVAHDLGVVSRVADRIAVMFAGKIVETGPAHQLVAAPEHPYTQRLLASVLRMDGRLPDDLSNVEPLGKVAGELCPYLQRCDVRADVCLRTGPELRNGIVDTDTSTQAHLVACHVVPGH